MGLRRVIRDRAVGDDAGFGRAVISAGAAEAKHVSVCTVLRRVDVSP